MRLVHRGEVASRGLVQWWAANSERCEPKESQQVKSDPEADHKSSLTPRQTDPVADRQLCLKGTSKNSSHRRRPVSSLLKILDSGLRRNDEI